MTAALADEIVRIADGFNASQDQVEIQAIYKGGYADTLTAAIAASRAGQAPHLVQVFEVGTGTMLAAGKAVKPVWELAKETGLTIDPKAYIPAVRGYYSLADGRMASMPFNSSTAVMWYNKDAFRKAGLDPDKRAGHLAGGAQGGRNDQGQGRGAGGHDDVLAGVDPARAVQRAAQPALRHQSRRLRRPRRRIGVQQPSRM